MRSVCSMSRDHTYPAMPEFIDRADELFAPIGKVGDALFQLARHS
jgi:hypothetical protein